MICLRRPKDVLKTSVFAGIMINLKIHRDKFRGRHRGHDPLPFTFCNHLLFSNLLQAVNVSISLASSRSQVSALKDIAIAKKRRFYFLFFTGEILNGKLHFVCSLFKNGTIYVNVSFCLYCALLIETFNWIEFRIWLISELNTKQYMF